jgi:hypothetical protein
MSLLILSEILSGSVLHRVLKLIGDFPQGSLGHPFSFPVDVEETKHALWWLEGLNQSR